MVLILDSSRDVSPGLWAPFQSSLMPAVCPWREGRGAAGLWSSQPAQAVSETLPGAGGTSLPRPCGAGGRSTLLCPAQSNENSLIRPK